MIVIIIIIIIILMIIQWFVRMIHNIRYIGQADAYKKYVLVSLC